MKNSTYLFIALGSLITSTATAQERSAESLPRHTVHDHQHNRDRIHRTSENYDDRYYDTRDYRADYDDGYYHDRYYDGRRPGLSGSRIFPWNW